MVQLFKGRPLRDAVDFLAHQNGIRIMIDEQALEDIGVPTDEPVNLMLQDVELQSVLNYLLKGLGCSTIIRDEALIVTTAAVADAHLVTRVYDISDLAGVEQAQLLMVLQESLPDAQWKEGVVSDEGGTASILDDALVVKQSQSAHQQIVDLLGQLRRHVEQHPRPPFDAAEESHRSRTFESETTHATPIADSSQLVGVVLATRTDTSEQVELVEVSLGR